MKRDEFFEYQWEKVNPHRQVSPVRFFDEDKFVMQLEKVQERITEPVYLDFEKALNKKLPLRTRVAAFLRAENAAGRKAKIIKDAILLFTPYGRQISEVSEFLANEVIPTTKVQTDMNIIEKARYRLRETSTKAGVIVLVAILAIFGIETDAVVLTEAVEAVLVAVAALVAAVTALYEIFRREKS